MSCTKPIHAFPTGYLTENGKDELFLSFHGDQFIPGWQATKKFGHPVQDLKDYFEVPCGHCYECRKEKAQKWAFRCLYEASSHEENFFITLTFAPEFYKDDIKYVVRQVQLFFKRLRKHTDFRYFGCIERGDQGNRLHAHLLLFGPKLDRLIPWSRSGFMLYRSELIESCWPLGFSSVGVALVNAVANYIAKYTMKNEGKDCRLLMSRKPGIGLDQMVKDVQEDNPNPNGWKLLMLGDGRGNVFNGGIPRSLRERLGIDPDEEIARFCKLKIQNEMLNAGYSMEDTREFFKLCKYRFDRETSDKLKEVARNLGKF